MIDKYVTSNQAIYWNEKAETGELVAPVAPAFYQIEASDYTETRKMVILK